MVESANCQYFLVKCNFVVNVYSTILLAAECFLEINKVCSVFQRSEEEFLH